MDALNLEQLGIRFENKLIGLIDDAEWKHYLWKLTLNGVGFDYKTGIGHVGKFGQPTKPKLRDVLECLFTDYDCGNYSFTEFCDNCGYSNDSIKAFETYRACEEAGRKLRKALGAKFAEVRDFTFREELGS